MWNEPYLESCCRSALHRLCLSGTGGRPRGLRDEPCLARLERKGFACLSADDRYRVTREGEGRHGTEVLGGKRKA
ncbi:hypothetical protein [Acetobacter oeni]|uniref:Uncharacterized protein n=1 Tax=Acetobacter oeni TaxID=304077 RepID=A0A511XNE6_9PROT|nr:hypothetical protein [Acetobacter oeni]NHO20296.1 hypothetical protein [Acetobacter oeni]GEN64470.1 hypothetical protein AOE01nite_26940 [Acetobacter oeni]